jgi:hypothetical protein
MQPQKPPPEQDDLWRARLVEMIDMRHELVKQETLIDWDVFEREWTGLFPSHTARPATSTRLGAGLLCLQHAYGLSDETVVARWAENPYWQHFCGEVFFQHRLSIDSSSLTRWRKRIGEEGVEWMLTQTIEAGKRAGAMKGNDLKQGTVDTTVMEKNIAHPTDARLYETARRKLVGLARESGISLRQNYNRLGPRLAGQIGHMKNDGRLTRCPLKGTEGDALFALLCGSGHNIRMIHRHLRQVLRRLISLIQQICLIPDAEITCGQRVHVDEIAALERCSGQTNWVRPA